MANISDQFEDVTDINSADESKKENQKLKDNTEKVPESPQEEKTWPEVERRSGKDRRHDKDRRKIAYKTGKEQRDGIERRSETDRRQNSDN
jgi:hypothetical protein